MNKRTYTTTERARANEEFGEVSLFYRETIHEDGTVEWLVRGTSDGDYVNKSGVRKAECPIVWEKLHAARIAMGWVEVAS